MSEPLLNELPYKIEKSPGMMPFWDGLNDGHLKSTSCNKCNTTHYPPNPVLCPNCFGTDIGWVNLPKQGTITTWTNVTAPPQGFNHTYYLVTVKLNELDKLILGRYQGEEPNIGDQVVVSFDKVGNQSVILFKQIK